MSAGSGQISKLWLVLALLVGVMGCRAAEQTPAPPGQQELQREAIQLYPEATEVRLRINDLGYDDDGMRFSRPQGTRLNAEQRARLEAAFRQVTVVHRPPIDPDEAVAVAVGAACFVPHHFFEFLDARGQRVGEVAVCFCCTGAQLSPSVGRYDADHWLEEDIPAIQSLVADMGLPIDVGCDT